MTVSELLDRCLPRLRAAPPSISFVDACQAVQTVLARRLWENGSDLLRYPWESSEQPIGTSLIDLPSDMLGVAETETPFITYDASGSTQVVDLSPLVGSRSGYVTAADAVPQEYEIRGSLLEVFPGSSVAFNLHVTMYRRPSPLTQLSDELPWNGLHDQIFQDAVLHMAAAGGAFTAAVTPGLELAIRTAVDGGTAIRTGRRVQWLGVW